MPSTPTYTPQNAIDIVRKFARDAPITSMDSQLCDIVNSIIWTSYPWRWAQASLTAITLTDGVQDYTVADTNVRKLLRLRIVQTDTTPDIYRDLIVRDWLAPDLGPRGNGAIGAAALDPVSGKIRLDGAVSVPAGTTLQLQGEYWKAPTKITDANLSSAFLFDDEYFPVFVDGLKWKLYLFINDNRAGTVATDKSGRKQYTGQLGVFMEGLFEMMAAEDYNREGTEFPDSPLGESAGAGSSWVYGGF